MSIAGLELPLRLGLCYCWALAAANVWGLVIAVVSAVAGARGNNCLLEVTGNSREMSMIVESRGEGTGKGKGRELAGSVTASATFLSPGQQHH